MRSKWRSRPRYSTAGVGAKPVGVGGALTANTGRSDTQMEFQLADVCRLH